MVFHDARGPRTAHGVRGARSVCGVVFHDTVHCLHTGMHLFVASEWKQTIYVTRDKLGDANIQDSRSCVITYNFATSR